MRRTVDGGLMDPAYPEVWQALRRRREWRGRGLGRGLGENRLQNLTSAGDHFSPETGIKELEIIPMEAGLLELKELRNNA